MTTSNDFNRFDEIQYKPLRVYNRVVMLNNLRADSGREVAQQYASQFTPEEIKEMYLVQLAVNAKGQAEVAREVTRGFSVVEA